MFGWSVWKLDRYCNPYIGAWLLSSTSSYFISDTNIYNQQWTQSRSQKITRSTQLAAYNCNTVIKLYTKITKFFRDLAATWYWYSAIVNAFRNINFEDIIFTAFSFINVLTVLIVSLDVIFSSGTHAEVTDNSHPSSVVADDRYSEHLRDSRPPSTNYFGGRTVQSPSYAENIDSNQSLGLRGRQPEQADVHSGNAHSSISK